MLLDSRQIEELLKALGEQLAASPGASIELVVCGGTAMNFLGFVARPTQDVDVVALLRSSPGGEPEFMMAKPLPPAVLEARDRVARDFQVAPDWLNDGPALTLELGLPAGCIDRLVTKPYGPALIVHFLGRFDLICLKLYALADSNITSRHFQDLRALDPNAVELEQAARWARTHDDSPGFLPSLKGALKALGAEDVAARIS